MEADRPRSVAAAVDEGGHKAWLLRCMEVYAAQVDRMDQGIGRIVESLRAAGSSTTR
jgi:arylsulfatase A-like enzyme